MDRVVFEILWPPEANDIVDGPNPGRPLVQELTDEAECVHDVVVPAWWKRQKLGFQIREPARSRWNGAQH